MRASLGLAALLLAAAAGLGGASDRARATPRDRGGVASLLGGLSAIVAQASWIRAEAALRDRRDADALYHLDLVTSLEPHLVAARDHVAREIGLTRASELDDPADRYSLVKEGLRILDDTVELNPAEPEAYLVRARYLREGIARDEPIRDLYEAESGADTLERVGSDYDAVLRVARDRSQYVDEAGVAYVLLSQKRFFGDGDPAAALEPLQKARDIYEGAVERFADEPSVLDVKLRVLAMVNGLIRVAETPAADRQSAYETVWEELGGAASSLPAPAARPR